jgi:DNA-binding transcriptional LysR family regulator
MDKLESMSTLVAAIEAGSLSAASRQLGVPLATVSRRVAELENHLGVRLLTRTSRRLQPTDAGRAYVAACRKVLDDIGEAERAATGEYRTPKGDLVLTAPVVFGRLHVLPVVMEFLRAYPDINVRLRLADSIVNLLEESIDLALRIGELPDSSLIATTLGSIRRVVCGSPDYFAKYGKPAHPVELSSYDCVTFQGMTSPGRWTFRTGGSTFSVAIRSRLTVNTAEAAIDAAIGGIGVTRVLSYQAAAAVEAGKLALVLRDFETSPLPVNLVHTGQPLMPIKLRAFIDFAAPRIRERLARLGG